MKNLVYFSLLFFAAIIIFSCKPCPDCPEIQEDNMTTLTTEDTISLAKFQTWVNNWSTYGKDYTDTVLTTYFTLPLIDITEFTENMATSGRDSVVAARFYLGLDRDTIPNMPHIMLVGVNAQGDSLTNAGDKQYIYDVSRPCPTMCGSNSIR
jgi:hypothetical protein